MTKRLAKHRQEDNLQSSRCSRCGESFECGMQAGRDRCWCAGLPAFRTPDPEAGCFCRRCLEALLESSR